VQNASARGHPLRVAVGDQAAASVGVLVGHLAIDHVGDGLEAAMRMPGRALGLTGGVVDLTHLVEVHEGVEQAQVDAGEGALHREALAFEAAGRGRHGDDRALAGGRVGPGQAREGQDVVHGDSRHVA